MNVILSDDEDDSQSHEEKCMAFVASYVPHKNPSDSKEEQYIDYNSSQESDDTFDEEIKKELDLQTTYDQLCEELVKTKKRNIKLNTKLKIFDEKMNHLQKCEGLIVILTLRKTNSWSKFLR